MKYLMRALSELDGYVFPTQTHNGEEDQLVYPAEYDEQAYQNVSYAGGHHEEHFGVHIEFTDLYGAIAFLAAVYGAGLFFSRCLRLPSLIGEIMVGIIMGPHRLDILGSMDQAFVLLGEVG